MLKKQQRIDKREEKRLDHRRINMWTVIYNFINLLLIICKINYLLSDSDSIYIIT